MLVLGNFDELNLLAIHLVTSGVKPSELSICSDFLLAIGGNVNLYNMVLDLVNAGVRATDLKICSDFLTSRANIPVP